MEVVIKWIAERLKLGLRRAAGDGGGGATAAANAKDVGRWQPAFFL